MKMIHYYEFSENEYYALVAVTTDENDLHAKPHKQAAEIYVAYVSGESVEEVLEEAEPNLRTKEYAFMKFIYGTTEGIYTVKEAIKDFEETKHGILLIDSSLV
jgi:hypothetical protein